MDLAPLQPIESTAVPMQMSPETVADTPDNKLVILQKIGSGKFGNVYLAKYSGREVALKMPMGDAEFQIMYMLRDVPGVVRLLKRCTVDKKTSALMQLCPKGDLFELMHRSNMSMRMRKFRIREIFEILAKVHARGVAHMDVKPENLVIDKRNNLLLTDFGLAVKFDPADPKASKFSGTLFYVAPEVIGKREYNPILADIWSAAVTAFAIVIGAVPFHEAREECPYFRMVAGDKWRVFWMNHEHDGDDRIPAETKEFLQFLLRVVPTDRPSIEAILAHAFFASLDE